MRLFILILILAAFLQTAFIPVNLSLILLLSRSLVVPGRSNLYAAFILGMVLGLLSSNNLGIWPFLYLVVVQIIQTAKRIPHLANIFTLTFLTILLIFLTVAFEAYIYKQNINLQKVLIESALVLPVCLLIRFWEERFIVRRDIRLKINR